MDAIGWILTGAGILLLNALFWVLLYQREVGALVRKISRLENRLVNQSGALAEMPSGAEPVGRDSARRVDPKRR